MDADQVQAGMQQIHEHLRVEMRRNQAVLEEDANRTRTPAPNIQEGRLVWLNARQLRTTRPTRTLEWTRLGQFRVLHRVSPYA
jgi:hypothetical protein